MSLHEHDCIRVGRSLQQSHVGTFPYGHARYDNTGTYDEYTDGPAAFRILLALIVFVLCLRVRMVPAHYHGILHCEPGGDLVERQYRVRRAGHARCVGSAAHYLCRSSNPT